MKVTRTCVVCGKKKTGGVGKFTKVKNLFNHSERVKHHLGSLKPDDYVCSGCVTTLKRLES